MINGAISNRSAEKVPGVANLSRDSTDSRPFTLAQYSPQSDSHTTIVQALLGEGFSSSNVVINGEIGRYLIDSTTKFVEWQISESGDVLYFRSFLGGQQALDLSYTYSVDGDFESMIVTVTGQEPYVVAESEKDSEGNIVGHWNYVDNTYTAISPVLDPAMMPIQTYQQCMQGCNFNGTQCTDAAKFKAAQATRAAMGRAAIIVVVGTVGGTLIAPGPGTAGGFVLGVLGGTLTLSLELANIHSQLKFDLKQFRDKYNNCVKGCDLLKPKKANGGGND